MLVIGNGESRKHIDVDAINDTKIGCNAILRDYLVEHLICVDRKMVREAITCLLYTSPSPRDRTRSRMPSSA